MSMNFLYRTVFDPRYEKIVHINDNRLIGGMCIRHEPKKYTKIQYMAIIPSFRKKNFGSLLINVLKSTLCST